MRQDYIVAYDISDPVRLRKVYEVMRGYGDHLQYSVFRCALNDGEHVRLQAALWRVIHHIDDQVLFVSLGLRQKQSSKRFATLGRPMIHPQRHAFVV